MPKPKPRTPKRRLVCKTCKGGFMWEVEAHRPPDRCTRCKKLAYPNGRISRSAKRTSPHGPTRGKTRTRRTPKRKK